LAAVRVDELREERTDTVSREDEVSVGSGGFAGGSRSCEHGARSFAARGSGGRAGAFRLGSEA
jgi:hypothetical protein